MHDSFLAHQGYRHLWFSLSLVLVCLLAYLWHSPVQGANGGTWLGYTLGGLATAIILWLTLFGYRKRTYKNRVGSVRGWLSAHVYLGTCLLIIASLHCGFQFGMNIHTLAYALMVAVILSGFFGVYAYLRFPTLMTRNRASASRGAMLEEIAELDEEALRVADKISPKVHSMVVRSIANTRIGGSVWEQLAARDGSHDAVQKTKDMIEDLDRQRPVTAEMPTMFAVVDFLAGSGGQEAERLRQLMDLLSRKKNLASRVVNDIQYQALMDIWLYLHVPLTFALLAALIAHIVSVFFYW